MHSFRLEELKQDLDEERERYNEELLAHICQHSTMTEKTYIKCEECLAFESIGGRRSLTKCECRWDTQKRVYCLDCETMESNVRRLKQDVHEILYDLIQQIMKDNDSIPVLTCFEQVNELVAEIRKQKRVLIRNSRKTLAKREDLV